MTSQRYGLGIFLLGAVATLLAVASFSYLIRRVVVTHTKASIAAELEHRAAFFSETLKDEPAEKRKALVDRLSRTRTPEEADCYLFDGGGVPIAGGPAPRMAAPRLVEEADGSPVTKIPADPLAADAEPIIVLAPIKRGFGAPEAWFGLEFDLDALRRRMGRTDRALVITATIASCCGFILAAFAARRTSRQFDRMLETARSLAAGDYDACSHVDRRRLGPFGDILGPLDSLAADVQSRIRTGAAGRRHLDAILQSMIEGVIAVDQNEAILTINDPARQMLELGAAGIEGKRLTDLVRATPLVDGLARVQKTGRPEVVEFTIAHPPLDRIVQCQAAPLRDVDRKITGAVAVLHDLTQIRKLETMRRDFVANVSHELKTPLTSIQGAAATIVDDPEMPNEIVRRFVGRIHTNAERLEQLINDILELSRIQSGDDVLEREILDLRTIARESILRFADDAVQKKIVVTADISDEIVPVHADRRALAAVADNLLSNALRYTPETGTVTVRVKISGQRGILEFADTGIGIEAQHLDRIFERFYRVDTSRSRALGGTGLGLAIVKHWVLAHQGEVRVSSTPGKGSIFTVQIPIADP